jgi:hypothetical protein
MLRALEIWIMQMSYLRTFKNADQVWSIYWLLENVDCVRGIWGPLSTLVMMDLQSLPNPFWPCLPARVGRGEEGWVCTRLSSAESRMDWGPDGRADAGGSGSFIETSTEWLWFR